jgi:hypothetical protein
MISVAIDAFASIVPDNGVFKDHLLKSDGIASLALLSRPFA